MIWICLVLGVVAISSLGLLWCSLVREKKLIRAYDESIKALEKGVKITGDLKHLAEQCYENERKLRMEAELRLRQVEMRLPKRDSKGRFCKK